MYVEILEELYKKMGEKKYQARRVAYIDKICIEFNKLGSEGPGSVHR